jgi:translation initiation factor 6
MFGFLKTNFLGDTNVGLYGFATDKYALLGYEPNKKILDQIKKILAVKIINVSIAGSQLLGVFCAGNSNGVLIPKIVEDYELRRLKERLDLNLEVIKSKQTALGNMILCNDNGCIIPKVLAKFRKQIKDCLDCEVGTGTVANLRIVGSASRASNTGCLCHMNAKENEVKMIEEILKVKADIGTVNYGTPFIKTGIIVNNKGFVTSTITTGPELDRIFEVFK